MKKNTKKTNARTPIVIAAIATGATALGVGLAKAFKSMKENAIAQHEVDKAEFCRMIDTFMEAGAIIMNPNCSVCWGSCQGVIGEGEVLVSTGTRNFKGRAGHRDSFVYLGSAATVTASAIKGEICGPQDL
jgi:aconitase A